jgi:tetratricopeptide (TPR) repeat protein
VPEARFCRLCGTPLKVGGGREDAAPVSPKAQTIPLTGEPRSTDGLGQDEPRRPAPNTSRVGRAEMDKLLRSASVDVKPSDGDAEKTGAQTTTLVSDKLATESGPKAAASTPASPNTSSRRRWQVAAVALLCVALIAGVLAFILSRRSGSTAEDGSSPISISDQQQLVAEKLAEAETLLASGEFNRAITVLRAAAKLSPGNAEVRMRLGNALERTGARDEAIAEYRAAAESNQANEAAWRALASAQFEEKLYSDAADSYRRLAELTGELDEETQLNYAEALRLAGRVDEARVAYQRIYNSALPDVARAARARLAELGPAPATPAANTNEPRPRAEEQKPREERPAEIASASPIPPPLVVPTRTPVPAATPDNVAPRVDYDSYYFQAVNIVNGREPKQIERAELLHALALFQKAALGGTHRGEAQRYADRLGKEYDRRRKL